MAAGGRTISEPRISPDATTVAVVVTWGTQTAIVLLPLEGGPEVYLTTSPAPLRGRPLGGGSFAWLPDGTGLVYAASDGNLWLQRAVGGAPRRIIEQPPGRPVTCPAVSPDGARVAYVVDQRDVAVVGIAAGAPWPVRLSLGTNDFALDPTWSADGGFVAWHEWDVPAMPWDESRWVVAPSDASGPNLSFAEPSVQVQQPRFAPNGSDLAFLCDRTGWLNLTVLGPDRESDSPLVSEPFEHGSPTWGGGQRTFVWSPDGNHIAFCRNEQGFGRLCVVDLATGVVREVAKAVHGGLDWVGNTLVAVRTGGRTPAQVVAYNTATWQRRVLARGPVAGWEASTSLVEPTAVEYAADDGALLYGLLYRPADGGHRGVICWLHGGPTDQATVSFNPRVAYFVERGWTVLMPNHRGSTGFGRDYTQAMRDGWGIVDVADTVAALRAVVEHGWGRADRLVMMGGSAGGFTMLNALAAHPGVVRAAIALYPVTDLTDDDTLRYEAHYFDSLVPDNERARRSPLAVASQITTPLLLLCGDADQVVSHAQVQRLAASCPAVELHVYPGEGHGWRRPETTIDELERIVAFLARHGLR